MLEIGNSNLDRFFVECVLASCNDFTVEKNRERAKLLASKYALQYPNGIEELYNKGLQAHKAVSEKIVSDRLAELRRAEEEEYAKLNRYCSLYGKDKKITMLTDRMNELRKQASSLDKGAKMIIRSTQKNERDWAIWGGVADGLAGPAAGIATALEIQAQNVSIRMQNEANMRAAMPVYMSISNSAFDNRKYADMIEKEIQLVKEKLILEIAPNEVFSKLSVVNPIVEVSESGAYRVSATVQVKEKLYIFDNVPAVADGTIIAHVYEGDKEIGIANLVLPVNGVSSKTGVVGMGLFGAHPQKEQTVKFTAGKMWLLEQ